jgi:hypothetical protein
MGYTKSGLISILSNQISVFRLMASSKVSHSLTTFAILALLIFSIGCTHLPVPGPKSEQATLLLQEQLLDLGPQVDANEAKAVARVAVEEAIHLASEYRAVRPAWFHNVLVNYGFRERGLCFHWANDLYARLYMLHCRSMELCLAVARMDTRREHNAIMVTARGKPFETGVILDAWRNSGRLWSGPASLDHYPWEPLPPDRIDPGLQEFMRKNRPDILLYPSLSP